MFKLLILSILGLMVMTLTLAAPQEPAQQGEQQGADCGVECLKKVIPGEPKKDYPIYGQSFLCKLNPKNPGCPGWGK